MNVAILSSSRADYSIYLPLLKRMRDDKFFNLKIIAFGTHLSPEHGYTVTAFHNDGFDVDHQLQTVPDGDHPVEIAAAMGTTMKVFAPVWEKEKSDLDLVLALGDRYEMFAAVAATLPFNIPVGHIHGGETTLGAIDNKFRHSITCMSSYHFASTEEHAKRVAEITGTAQDVYNVGALSLDNLADLRLLSTEEFKASFGIPINEPVLVTFHPETVAYEENERYAAELVNALKEIEGQVIITMPNADTNGLIIRKKLQQLAGERPGTYVVESLGTVGYFSCIKHSRFLLGNSSSGIIEAASFGKYVINLGDRQKGRAAGANVLHCAINKDEILDNVKRISTLPALGTHNIYGDGHASQRIIEILKKRFI